MIYADDAFYQKDYLLGRPPVIRTGFPFYARQASQVIDQYTFGRPADLEDIPEAVKLCCCELAEVIHRQEKQRKEATGKTSEKVGTYSISYSGAKETAEAAAREQGEVVMKWLATTGLCYKGV